MLDFVNAILINLSIIVSTALTLYFLSVRQSLTDNQVDSDFMNHTGHLLLSKNHQIFLGIIVGILCFFISLNKIPVPLYGGISVDVRYLPIFFSIYYGSTLIGVFNGGTLIILKLIQYSLRSAHMYEIFNNIFLTISLVILATIIKKQHFSQKKSVLIFLVVALSIRLGTFCILFSPPTSIKVLINVLSYIMIFSLVFLFTAWLIDSSISISKTIHVYRTSSIYDHLTKLYNKESFYFFLDHVYHDLIMNQATCGVAILDIDNFKQINDHHGHLAGDQVLIHIANLLTLDKPSLESPRICRIGGDEFAMIFKSPIIQPEEFIEKKLIQINQTPCIYENLTIPIEISCGLAIIKKTSIKNKNFSTEDMFKLADSMLYKAKKIGKNQLVTTYRTI
ncbi:MULTISPECIES: GGDEF domain-containing protein [unclassified Vagococcus]|uniref:GGDEF domain-containing protein n=1 Tax=unclassified Vagococcus TaxID=2648499 RepID=UPI001F511846|nr:MULTISPECIES: GGDEF domain-containing protein [unclassified Vagococcus]MCI0130760.1 GGDEF domain-containing protein [Vagococcus sp. CY53-2]UNM89150.1 GGDEF domain-containing protein [Vagococcus sp. CY52-2]